MKMTKEEKALREWPEAKKMNGSQINLFYKEVRAMRRAIIEECIVIYYDWESRPEKYHALTYPEAARKGMKWREAIRARKEGK